MAQDGSRSREVIVAGGDTSTVEKYHSDDWGQGNGLPFGLQSAASVQTGDSFVLVGGADETHGDAILTYLPEIDGWTIQEDVLRTAKQYPTAIPVQLDIFPPCA